SAGDEVGYELVVTNRGEPVVVEAWTLHSDLEPELAYDRATLSPVVAGEHALSFAGEAIGWSGTVEAALTVHAGAAYDVDLRLSDAAALAGEAVGYEVFALDAFGNELPTERAAVWSDDERLVVSERDLSTTLPGHYLVTAELDGVQD